MMNRYKQVLGVLAALALFGGIGAALAQDVANGQRLSERWCAECHAIGPVPGKSKARSFAAIAAKESITAEMIASFLHLPHATMPNVPLRRNDAQDIAAFIMAMKR